MFKLEAKFWNFILKWQNVLFVLFITAVAVMLRISGREFISGDMSDFLLNWYNDFANGGGINALSKTIGDQNLLFQTVISIMPYIKIDAVYLFKIFSVFFDWVLALGFAACVVQMQGKKLFCFDWGLGYAIVILLPTVILNSAFWGQCDSMYTAFLMLTMLCLLKERFFLTFIFFGIAIAFKLQSIFMLPFLFCYYLYKKKFSILMFLVSIFAFWFSGIVAYIKGQNLFESFKIYLNQTDIYHAMYLNFCSFWALVGDSYDEFKLFGVLLVLALCVIGIYMVLCGKKKFETQEQIVNTYSWFLWTCLLFLPAMHDRYAYPLDIFLILLCFTKKSYLKYAILSVLVSLVTYGKYLNSNDIPYYICTLLYIFAYFHYTYYILIKETDEDNASK